MPRSFYRVIEGGSGFVSVLAAIAAAVAVGLLSAWYMEEHGHVVTGMNNHVVWGLPHVFAFFLIVAASGALNVASMASVFGRIAYKPMTRLSGLLAVSLLAGGLSVLVLDLGRPDRLLVAMTTYNFKSIFAWNIYFYTGFAAIVAGYLFVQMARGFEGCVKAAGLLAFLWRLALTTATGSVLGFLMARQAYYSAIMAPLFIAMSLAVGQAIFLLVAVLISAGTGRPIGDQVLSGLTRLIGIFAAATLYFTVVLHLTNLYAAKQIAVERFMLLEGGIYTALFWIGYVGLGAALPIAIAFSSAARRSRALMIAVALLVILGGFSLLYVFIVGGQAFPLLLFPGMEVTSSFDDGVVSLYRASLPELGLGIGGVAIAGLLITIVIRLFPILPMRLDGDVVEAQAMAPAPDGTRLG